MLEVTTLVANKNPWGFQNPKGLKGKSTMNDDPYLDVIDDQWENILMMYNMFAAKRPVMLFDVQEQRIYAYPYKEFKAELSPRSQATLEDQYRQAGRNHQMVVFVRDNEKEKLVSYNLDFD
jgi:hypothetical protein